MILQVEWDWWGPRRKDLIIWICLDLDYQKKKVLLRHHLETIELNCSLFNSFPLLHSHDMTNDMHPLHGLSRTTSPL